MEKGSLPDGRAFIKVTADQQDLQAASIEFGIEPPATSIHELQRQLPSGLTALSAGDFETGTLKIIFLPE